MYTIIVIIIGLVVLTALTMFMCGGAFPDRVKAWWDSSILKKWSQFLFFIILTSSVIIGIACGVLKWITLILPVMYILPFFAGMVLGFWNNIKEKGKKLTYKNGTEAIDIAVKCLNELGCQPEIRKDGSVRVSYQGEHFVLEFGGRYARIWNPMWGYIKADDPDAPKIREAVNATNFNFGPTVVMTAPDEDGDIGLHSRRDIMLHPACPDNVPFVKAVLDSFFDAKEQVRTNFQQINAKQMETQKNRRPVGFTTSTTEE